MKSKLSLNECVTLGLDVYVVYSEHDMVVVSHWPFGKNMAQRDASARTAASKHTYLCGSWEEYIAHLEKFRKNEQHKESLKPRV